MALIVTPPFPITFSKEVALWQFEDDRAGLISGIEAENIIAIDGSLLEGAQMVIRWGENEQRYTATAVPAPTGNFLPLYTYNVSTHEAFVKSLVPIFQGNYFLNEDFIVEAKSFTIFGQTIWQIQLTARQTGAKFNCIKTRFQGGGVSNAVVGVDDQNVFNNSVFIEIFIGDADSVNYERIFKASIDLDENSRAQLNVSDILHAHLEPEIPGFVLPVAQKCKNSRRKYYLRYAPSGGENFDIGSLQTTEQHVVILGGGTELNGSPRTVTAAFKNPVSVEDKYLMLRDRTRYIRQDEPVFVTWLNFSATVKNIHAAVLITFADGTTVSTNTGVVNGVVQYEKLLFAVGFKQLNLGFYAGTKVVSEYSVQLRDDTGFVSEPLHCIVNYAHEEYVRYFAHINSHGALETITTFGKGSSTWKVFKETAEKLLPYQFDSKSAQFVEWNINYQDTTEVATGFYQKRQLKWFLDFFLSAVKYQIVNGVAFSVGVSSDSIERGTDGQNQFGFVFEYKYQRTFEYISAEDIASQEDPAYVPSNLVVAGNVTVGNPAGNNNTAVDPYPMLGSLNPVSSSGVWAMLQLYQQKLAEGNIDQFLRGDGSLFNLERAVNALEKDGSVPSFAKTLDSLNSLITKIALPDWLKTANSAGRVITNEAINYSTPTGIYPVVGATVENGFPFEGDGAIIRVVTGDSGARKGADIGTSSSGETFTRSLNEADGDTDWEKVDTGEEPTFANIPLFHFPIGQVTTQTIDLERYLVTSNHNLKMKELATPDFIQSMQTDGLKVTLTGYPTDAKQKSLVVEVTDIDSGKSRTVDVSLSPRPPVVVNFNWYNAVTSSAISAIAVDGSSSFVNIDRADFQFVVPNEPHNGVYAAIVGGGPDGNAINEKWTENQFEPLPQTVNGGTYRMWAFINGRAIPAGHYTILFKTFLDGAELSSNTIEVEITEQNIAQADFELWDEAIGIGYKVDDIKADNTSVFQPVTNGDIHFSVKNVLHNQVFARIKKDGTEIFSWGTPHENVTEAETAIYQLFGPAGYHNLDAGVYDVEYFAFLNNVQVFTKDSTFTISGDTTPVVVGRFEFWNETGTAAKVGNILFNNSSSFAAIPRCDIRFNLFNIDHNQVYAELRNSAGVAIAAFGKPYETVPQALNAVYQMFGAGYGTNIGAGTYSAYFVAKKDGNTVYEKTAGFILTSADVPSNGIVSVELKNNSTGVKVGDIPVSGGSFPVPSAWDVPVTTDRAHDYASFILSKKINGSYDNNSYVVNNYSGLTPVSGSVTRYLFDNRGNASFETASLLLQDGTYRLQFTTKTGGASGIVVTQVTYEFTLTASAEIPDSEISLWRRNPDTASNTPFLLIANLPVSGGNYALPSTKIEFKFSRSNNTVTRADVKIEEYKNGAYYPLDMGVAGPYSLGPTGVEKLYSFKWIDRDNQYNFFNDVMGVGDAGNIYENGVIRGNINKTASQYRVTVYEKNSYGTTQKTKQTTFSFGTVVSSGLAPFSQTPKKRITIKNVNGVYSDIEPGEEIVNGVRYRNENGRRYKVLYYINEKPWAAAGDLPKDLGEVAIPNGLLITIRKIYADVNWVGSTTFQNYLSHGWDIWIHGTENPAADGNWLLAIVMCNFTTNGGVDLNKGNLIRKENPAWLVANKVIPQFFLNASPYTRAPKPVCVQCIPMTDSVQETVKKLADGGVTHIFWQALHGAGMYNPATGQPYPELNMYGILPCFNLASQDIKNAVKSATGYELAVNEQCTRDQARTAANYVNLINGAVYTDEFSEGSYPQLQQSRDWYYERVYERMAELGITCIFAGDYGYGSQNIRINNPANTPYMRSLMDADVVNNLENIGGSNHTGFKQYAQANKRDTVMGAYYAITGHPLYRRMNGLPIEAIISINAIDRNKVRFCTPIMQSNANGTDVPYKDSGTINPNGSVSTNFPDAPAEMSKMDGFLNRFFYDAGYIWDAWGVRNISNENNFQGMQMGFDAWMEGSRWYDMIYPALLSQGMVSYATDYTSNGVAFTSTTPERRISSKGHKFFGNIYFNEAIDAGKGALITIRSTKKWFIYWNCNLHPTEKEHVIAMDQGVPFDMGDVAGNTLCIAVQP